MGRKEFMSLREKRTFLNLNPQVVIPFQHWNFELSFFKKSWRFIQIKCLWLRYNSTSCKICDLKPSQRLEYNLEFSFWRFTWSRLEFKSISNWMIQFLKVPLFSILRQKTIELESKKFFFSHRFLIYLVSNLTKSWQRAATGMIWAGTSSSKMDTPHQWGSFLWTIKICSKCNAFKNENPFLGLKFSLWHGTSIFTCIPGRWLAGGSKR